MKQAEESVDNSRNPFVDRHRPPPGNINAKAQGEYDGQRRIEQHQLENQGRLFVLHALYLAHNKSALMMNFHSKGQFSLKLLVVGWSRT